MDFRSGRAQRTCQFEFLVHMLGGDVAPLLRYGNDDGSNKYRMQVDHFLDSRPCGRQLESNLASFRWRRFAKPYYNQPKGVDSLDE